MNKKQALSVITLGALIASCSTLSVYEGDVKKKGVPFYIKKHIYEHETIWSSAVHDVTIKFLLTDATGDQSKSVTGTIGQVSIPQSLYYGPEALALRSTIDNVSPTSSAKFENITDSFNSIRKKIAELQKASAAVLRDSDKYGLPKQTQLVLVSNKLNSNIVVDTTTDYYINGNAPLFGTGTGNFDLSPDMTLTSIESTVEDKTAETILSALPVTEFFTKQWALDTDADTEDMAGVTGMLAESEELSALMDALTPKSTALISIELTSVSRTTFYHFKKIIKSPDEFGSPIVLETARSPGSKVQIDIKQQSTEQKSQGDSEPTYKFSGEVALPTEKKE